MLFLSRWLREFVDIPVDDARLAEDLTMAGIAIETVGTAENGEPVLDADITTNRPDAMNHYGVAREASAIYDRDLKPYGARPREGAQPAAERSVGSGPPAAERASVEIADPDLCARYSARVITGVKVGPSPEWMVRRLEAAGARSINNVADVTNYLLIELGHPLHAFDLDTLAGRKIIVRRARPGEKLVTLDGVTREFTTDDLMIADSERAVAIAGVMGGGQTGIREGTTNVLLESAWFEPLAVRRTAKRQGMHTDASHRFERGADLAITAVAAGRAAELIREVAGGEILAGVLDVFPAPGKRPSLILHARELERILGAPVPPGDVLRILTRLGFRVAADNAGQWMVEPPSFRLDVEREIDVVEEVARHYGYNRFPNRLPASAGVARRAPNWEPERALRATARGLGYSESISYSLIPARDAERFAARGARPVRIANPISEEAAALRTSGVPSALHAVEWNLNRGARSVRLFEIGKIYWGENGRPDAGYAELPVLTLAASGPAVESSLHLGAAPVTPGAGDPEHSPRTAAGFFELKGDVETLLDLFEHAHLYFDSAAGVDYYHPGRAARAAMDGETVARFGEIHPRIAAERKLRQPVLVAELLLDRLYARGLRRPRYQPPPRVPAVGRDLSLLVPEGVTFEQVAETARRLGIAELAEIQPAEILRGGPAGGSPQRMLQVAGEGRYGLLLRLSFQRPDQTLSDPEVNEWSRAIAAALEEKLKVIQRT